MKTAHTISASAVSILVLASAAFGAGDNATSKSQSHSQSSDLSSIQRVSQDRLDGRFTATDLIGTEVYDQAGEKIGDISDFSLAGNFKDLEFAKNFAQSAKEGWSDAKNDMSMNDDMKDRDWSDKAKGALKGGLGDSLQVFISVGGVLGIGNDIVAVPASSLSYDQPNRRFTLSASKEDVVAIAEGPEYGGEDYASDESDMDDDSYSASRGWSQDVTAVREALRQDNSLMNEASGITVRAEDEKIILEGSVTSQSAKDRAAQVAQKATEADVKNSIKVK